MTALRVQCETCRRSVEPTKAVRHATDGTRWWCRRCFREMKSERKRKEREREGA